MPNPITSSDRSPFSSPASSETVDACNPELASCGVSTSATHETSRSVTIAPVYVTGERDSAVSELVRRHDAAASACDAERDKALVTCELAASAAVGTALMVPSGIGFVASLATTVGNAVQCGQDLAKALDCDDRAQRLAEADADCTDSGGILLTTAKSELVCLVTR
jgi:hypothetical protein